MSCILIISISETILCLALLFHPDLIKGTALGKKMSQYSFFSYESHEALHLSLKEQQIIKDLFGKLEYELSQSIDNLFSWENINTNTGVKLDEKSNSDN